MNAEAANRCRRWLEEQLEHLRGLRNGNPRDAQFKQWRQTTLTVLQRIWPSESTRSERFRRIRFSSPQSRVDARSVADWYTRGCDEAASQLAALIAEIDREGVPATAAPELDALDPDTNGAEEAAFPTLDLSGSQGGASVEIPGDRDIVLDLGGPSASSAPVSSREESDAPAPPRLRVSVPARTPRAASKSTPSRSAPPPAVNKPEVSPAPPAPPARAAEAPRSRGSRRASGKGRLRELLGLDDVIARVHEEESKPVVADATSPIVDPKAAEAAIAAAAPAPEAVETPSTARVESPAEPTPTPEPDFTKAAVDDALARMTVRPRGSEPAHVVPPIAITEAEPASEPISAPAEIDTLAVGSESPSVVADDAPLAEADAPKADVAEFDTPDAESEVEYEEATQRFLETSPVLSLTGRPVHRHSDATRFEHPDAVALATLAEDAARLGVPEHRRDAVKSQLEELAQRFESGDPDWHLLAEVAREAMLHRPLAERLMPVLLPWLSRAA